MATQGKEPTQAATQIAANLGREGNQWEGMITIRVVIRQNQWEGMITIRVVIRWQPRLVSSNQMATQIGNPGIGTNSSGNPDCRITGQFIPLAKSEGSRENGSLIRSLAGEACTWENGNLVGERYLGKTGIWQAKSWENESSLRESGRRKVGKTNHH